MTIDPVDHAHVVAVVRQNPRRPGERAQLYIARIAVLSGLVEPGQVGDAPPGGWSSAGDVAASTPEKPDNWWVR